MIILLVLYITIRYLLACLPISAISLKKFREWIIIK